MKRIYLIITACIISTALLAQSDSTNRQTTDTIKVGGMIIIKKDGPEQRRRETNDKVVRIIKQQHSNVNTAQFIIDIGFASWTDKTDYAAATSQGYIVNKPGTGSPLGSNDFKLKWGQSSNVNIWVFMQRLNLIKHYVNLKYGIGVELNNYRFVSNISFKESGANPYNASQIINHPFVFRDSINFSKNKLSTDYVTVPLMVNFRTNPERTDRGISFSAGVSMGYLYNSRNKQISSERGKLKNHGNYDLEKWKFSYVGEIGLRALRLYGSYAPKSIFENSLDLRPYTIGIRLSNW